MLRRSTRSDASRDESGRLRSGRGLGPFTGGQLTTMFITLVLVAGFPFAAFAVTGQNVFVTDATSGKTAKVDTGGHVLSKVSGTVSAVTRPADYSQWKTFRTVVTEDGCHALAVPTSGNAVVIQSLSVDFFYNPSGSTFDEEVLYSGACGDNLDFISAPAGGIGHLSIPYEPGLVSTSGFSIARAGGSDANFSVTATGFEIPASSLTP